MRMLDNHRYQQPLPEGLICCACPEGDRRPNRCEATYVCATCGKEVNICASRMGGLDSKEPDCNLCWERKNLGRGWYRFWVTGKGRA